MRVKMYMVKGCLVTNYGEGMLGREDENLDVFFNKKDAEKAIEFYNGLVMKNKYYKDLEIETVDAYSNFEEFEKDMWR